MMTINFTAFSHSILQEFAVNKVTCMIHSEIVRTLHNQRTGSYRVLKRNASNTYVLNIRWDFGISPMFSRVDLACPAACHFSCAITYSGPVKEANSASTTTMARLRAEICTRHGWVFPNPGGM